MLQYMCPNCNGQLVYDSKTESLKCESCQSEIDPTELLEPEASDTCKNCGSPLNTKDNTYSDFCPSCQSSFINEEALSKEDPPEYIAPFEIEPQEAEKKFSDWLSTRRWIPESLRKDIRISARNKYLMPFYCYGFYNQGKQVFDCVKLRFSGSGKNKRVKRDHYDVTVEGTAVLIDYPVDAMIELKDEIVDFISPFDNEKCAEFLPPLFSGVHSKRQDYTREEMEPRALEACKRYTAEYMQSHIKDLYVSKKLKKDNMEYELTSAVLVYYPVYILTLSYRNNSYSFYMNGQTGKICGETPISKPKVIIACALYWILFILLELFLIYILF